MTCSKYNSGMLNEPVEFQRAAKTSDGAGGYTEAWVPVLGSPTMASVKAANQFVRGGETFRSGRIESSYRWKLVVRYFDGLLESDTVILRGKVHNIRFIDNVELKNQWMVLDVDGGKAV